MQVHPDNQISNLQLIKDSYTETISLLYAKTRKRTSTSQA